MNVLSEMGFSKEKVLVVQRRKLASSYICRHVPSIAKLRIGGVT